MFKQISFGREIKVVDMFQLLPADEGEMNCVYGRIGNGKTLLATKMVVDALKRGQVVYANWKIDFTGYDERDSKWLQFLGVLGIKRQYYDFNAKNLHYINMLNLDSMQVDGKVIGEDWVTWVSKLTDCICFFDEAQIPFDSYEKTAVSIAKRNMVNTARHFDRSYYVISQRPSAVQVTLRANVNRFFKCEKVWNFNFFGLRIQRFKVTEFQDTTSNDLPDEKKVMKLNEETHMIEETDEYALAIKVKYYFGTKKLFKLYDSKYRRMGVPTSQPNNVVLYELSWVERFNSLFSLRNNKGRDKNTNSP